MKKFAIINVAVLILACSPLSSQSQGTFGNLGFEQATTNPSITVSNWTLYSGSIAYNTVGIGGAAITLHDSMSTHFQPLQGNYSILLQGSQANTPTSSAIGQTGQIPVDSLSVRYWAYPGSNLQLTFGGQLIPVTILSSTASYNVFGGNVSAFAGQTAELRFTALAHTAGLIDNIQFSNQPIPEPSVFCLIGLGALLFCRQAARKET